MGPSNAEIGETLRRLRATPQHVKRSTTGLSDAELRRRPPDAGWSVNEVMAHLRGAADVRGNWIARMLAEEVPTIRYASPRTGMRKVIAVDDDAQASIRAFAQQRADLVKTLSSLTTTDWDRRATFTGTTPGWSPSIFDLATGMATHEHAHFEQISKAVGSGATGPDELRW